MIIVIAVVVLALITVGFYEQDADDENIAIEEQYQQTQPEVETTADSHKEKNEEKSDQYNSQDNVTASNGYEDSYPELFMREKDLTKTKLGEPDKIEPCQSFDSLAPRARYKDYYWGDIYSDNFCHVTVDYVRHFSKQVDDYETYPSDNGYVSYVSYYDPETGETYTFDELDIIEQW